MIASVVCFLQYAGLSKLISVVIPRCLYGLVETVSELCDVIPNIVLGSWFKPGPWSFSGLLLISIVSPLLIVFAILRRATSISGVP